MPYKNKTKAKESKRKSYLKIKNTREEWLVTQRYSSLKYRYKNQEILSLEEYKLLICSGVCHYCNGSLPKRGIAIDRLNYAKGHVVDNCVPCCSRCNSTFWNHYTYEEKLLLAETIKKIDFLRRNDHADLGKAEKKNVG